jgi:hypothetical protein
MRASRNAAKHRIFSKTLMPDEKTKAIQMGLEFMYYFGLQGTPETEIGIDMVRNRLEKHRIDKYAIAEFAKAPLKNQMEKFATLFQDPIQGATSTRPHPRWHVLFSLKFWKALLEMRGPRLDEDAKFIDAVFSGQEEKKEQILFVHQQMAPPQEEQDEKSAKLAREEYQAHILGVIESEIKGLEILTETESEWGCAEFDSTLIALPPEDTLDRIARYRAANGREFRRCLEELETIRRLRYIT